MSRRPGRGRGAGAGARPSPRASAGARSRPAPGGRAQAARLAARSARPPPPPRPLWKSTASESDTSKIPRPPRPPSPARAAFLPRRLRAGERIPRTESAGRAGGGRAREPRPRFFFFHQEESARFFPSSQPWQAGGRRRTGAPPDAAPERGPTPSRDRVPGAPRRSQGAPACSRAKFPPGSPARCGAGMHFGRLGARPGLPSAPGPSGRGAGPGPLQPPVPALPHALPSRGLEERGSGRATHRVAHAFPAGSPEDPCCPLRCSRRRRRSPPPPPAAAAAQITTRRV